MINGLISNIGVLAETTTNAEASGFLPVDFIWSQIGNLTWLQAVVAISFGAVYLVYGCKIFKMLVVIAFAMLGLLLGVALGERFGGEWHIWVGLALAILFSVVSIPLMRWAVSLLGALAGAVLTSALWYALNLPENNLIFVGALVGFVAGGMLSFIIFDAAVVLFTSMAGGALIIMGLLALLRLYPHTSGMVQNWVFDYKWFLPTMLSVTIVIGFLRQKKLFGSEK